MIFYSFKPVDTLFFRGAEPMQMGLDHTSTSVFPPPAHTVAGAIRTAYLKQHNVDFKDYGLGKVEEKVHDDIGKAGENAPFSLIGPFFKKGDDYFVPAPFHWYVEKTDSEKRQKSGIIKSVNISSSLIHSNKALRWAKGEGELVSIGGRWIDLNRLYSKNDEGDLFNLEDFVSFENRTGIAIDYTKKTVKESHLYSFNHARLNGNVELVFGIDREIDLEKSGLLKVGAEQRFGEYKKIDGLDFKQSGQLFMSLSIVEGTEEANEAVVATGKIQYLGGWDLKKRFHKPMKGFFPAGSVFNKKLNNNFIKI